MPGREAQRGLGRQDAATAPFSLLDEIGRIGYAQAILCADAKVFEHRFTSGSAERLGADQVDQGRLQAFEISLEAEQSLEPLAFAGANRWAELELAAGDL
jgi:hypothetical protein